MAMGEMLVLFISLSSGIMLLGLFVCILIFILRSNGAAQASLKLVEADGQAVAALGKPLKIGLMAFGSINYGFMGALLPFITRRGHASLSLPVYGDRGKGRLRARAEIIDGVWKPYYASLQIGPISRILVNERRTYGFLRRFGL